MVVIRKCLIHIDLRNINLTTHIQSDGRAHRRKFYDHLEKKVIKDVFWIDKNHKNGPEFHLITEDAIILVLNAKTKRLCTVLIARPGQIERYYQATNQETPIDLILKARLNQWIKENY